MSRKFLASCFALFLSSVLLTTAAMAQSITISESSVLEGTTETSVTWSYTAGGSVFSLVFDIPINMDFIVPQTTTDFLNQEEVDGCLPSTPPAANAFCYLLEDLEGDYDGASHYIRVTLINNLPNQILQNTGGSITFDIASSAVAGDSWDLEIVEITEQTQPAGTEISGTAGLVEIISGPPAIAAIDPTSWAATAVLDGTPPTQTFTVRNAAATGQTPPAANLAISAIELSGSPAFSRPSAAAGGTCAAGTTSLAPGASCTVIIQLATTALGTFTGTLAVSHSAGETALTAALTGTVRDTDGVLTIDPTTRDFGSLDIDAPAVSQAFTIANSGSQDTVTGITVPDLTAPFAITTSTCGTTLAPGANCSITVSFNPSAVGTFTGTLAVNSASNSVSASLSGEGTATAVISINPPFGAVNLGVGAPGETLTRNGTVTNSGSAAAEVACTLDDESGVFSTSPSPLSATVAANSSVNFTLSCALPADGEEGDAFSATLTCSVDGDVAGTHELSCGVTEFEPLPVPTMSNWSIVLFALLMLLVGGISIRFFRV